MQEINRRTKEERKLQINKLKAPNKGGIIVIINNNHKNNID